MRRQAKVGELLDLLLQHYRANKLRSLYEVELIVKNQLRPHFGERAANLLRKSHIEDYKEERQAAGAANGTINRELARLKKAFNLGIEEEVIERKPVIRMLEEADPRTGSWTYEEFRRFEAAARRRGRGKNWDGDIVADIYMFSFFSGWRLEEAKSLNSKMVDADLKIAVLPGSKHKNKRAKIYPLEGEVWTMVERRLKYPAADGSLFHRAGRPVRVIRKMASTICRDEKIEKSFHDLRRSATSNLNRAGVIKETGKRITGHQNDALYHQYNQVELDELRDAVKKVYSHLEDRQDTARLTKNSDCENISVRVNITKNNEPAANPAIQYNPPSVMVSFGGEGGIRTPETHRESTRFPVLRPVLTYQNLKSFSVRFLKRFSKKLNGGAS